MKSRELHVAAAVSCCNNCIFCLDRIGGKLCYRGHDTKIVPLTSLAELRRELVASAGKVSEVAFTSGEPTLNKDLPRMIASAKAAGHRRILLITNGWGLADPSFCGKVIANGLSVANVSLHGHTRRLHESHTRRPGSFDRTTRALANLGRLKRTHDFTFNIICVLTKLNLGNLSRMLAFFSRFRPAAIQLNAAIPEGNALERIGEVIPRYRDVARELARCAAQIRAMDGFLYMQHMPECLFAGTAELFDPGKFIRFNENAIVGRSDRVTERPRKVKPASCRTCVHDASCEGVWKAYIDRMGWGEFRPVRAAASTLPAPARNRSGRPSGATRGRPARRGKPRAVPS